MEMYRSGHNEAVLKTVWAHAHEGSNPSLSAKNPVRIFAEGIFTFYLFTLHFSLFSDCGGIFGGKK